MPSHYNNPRIHTPNFEQVAQAYIRGSQEKDREIRNLYESYQKVGGTPPPNVLGEFQRRGFAVPKEGGFLTPQEKFQKEEEIKADILKKREENKKKQLTQTYVNIQKFIQNEIYNYSITGDNEKKIIGMKKLPGFLAQSGLTSTQQKNIIDSVIVTEEAISKSRNDPLYSKILLEHGEDIKKSETVEQIVSKSMKFHNEADEISPQHGKKARKFTDTQVVLLLNTLIQESNKLQNPEQQIETLNQIAGNAFAMLTPKTAEEYIEKVVNKRVEQISNKKLRYFQSGNTVKFVEAKTGKVKGEIKFRDNTQARKAQEIIVATGFEHIDRISEIKNEIPPTKKKHLEEFKKDQKKRIEAENKRFDEKVRLIISTFNGNESLINVVKDNTKDETTEPKPTETPQDNKNKDLIDEMNGLITESIKQENR